MKYIRGIPGDQLGKRDRAASAPDGHQHRPSTRAFSRLDGIALLAGLGLILLWSLPIWAGREAASEQAMCLANLFRVGRAFQLWGNDHRDHRPWRTPATQGGTYPGPGAGKSGNAWVEFASISNELVHPKFLVCPSDRETTRVAADFTSRPDGGFFNFNYRGSALSYFLGLDTLPETPGEILAGDRNLSVNATGVPCNSGVINAARILRKQGGVWTNGIHHFQGNALFNDGHVEMATPKPFGTSTLRNLESDGVHLLFPR